MEFCCNCLLCKTRLCSRKWSEREIEIEWEESLRRKWTLGDNMTQVAEQGSSWGLKSSHFLSLVFNWTCVINNMRREVALLHALLNLKTGPLALNLADTAFWAWLLSPIPPISLSCPTFLFQPSLFFSLPDTYSTTASSPSCLWSSRILGAQVQDCRATPHRPWTLQEERQAGEHAELWHLHFSHWHNPHVLFVPL